jgi:hypothetical protein
MLPYFTNLFGLTLNRWRVRIFDLNQKPRQLVEGVFAASPKQ